jgi:hypothetical protein
MLRILAAALLAAAIVTAATPAHARMHAPYRGHRIIPGGAAPPLDGMTAPSGAYSFRKLRSGYAGPAIRLRRASDNAELDINFLGCTSFTGCPWDVAAATSHCASTTCSVTTWYDQSGNARDLTQATQANQPALVFDCNGALPCLQNTLTAQQLATAALITPATGTVSISAVANRAAGTGFCTIFRQDGLSGNRLQTQNTTTQWIVSASAGTIVVTAPNAAWHAAQVVINGVSSVVNVDGTETTGTVTGATAAAASALLGSNSTTCNQREVIDWDAYPLTPGERATLTANQRAFWGF